jgi:hypothetical protein
MKQRKRAARRASGQHAPWRVMTLSVGVLASGLDGRTPLGDLGLDELLVFGAIDAGVGDHHGTQGLLALDELRVFQCGP